MALAVICDFLQRGSIGSLAKAHKSVCVLVDCVVVRNTNHLQQQGSKQNADKPASMCATALSLPPLRSHARPIKLRLVRTADAGARLCQDAMTNDGTSSLLPSWMEQVRSGPESLP